MPVALIKREMGVPVFLITADASSILCSSVNSILGLEDLLNFTILENPKTSNSSAIAEPMDPVPPIIRAILFLFISLFNT